MKADARWLLLIHQIPPKPAYFRAKVGRRLQRVGAVAIKNSVYVLPMSDQAQEDLQWIAREIIAEGGDATLCTANLVEGLRDEQVEALFQAAREADYAGLAEDARRVLSETPRRFAHGSEKAPELGADVARLRKRLSEVLAIDWFGAPGREAVEATIVSIEKRLRAAGPKQEMSRAKPKRTDFKARTWVTRKNVHVDRIGSAWLVRRFIDPKASFKFVEARGYQKGEREVTFDMFEADFTHIGDRCTFEVLLDEFETREPALRQIAEIIHDIDVKDSKFGRPEAPGVAALIAGISVAHREDDRRLEVGGLMFDALLKLYQRRRRPGLGQ